MNEVFNMIYIGFLPKIEIKLMFIIIYKKNPNFRQFCKKKKKNRSRY